MDPKELIEQSTAIYPESLYSQYEEWRTYIRVFGIEDTLQKIPPDRVLNATIYCEGDDSIQQIQEDVLVRKSGRDLSVVVNTGLPILRNLRFRKITYDE